ncbi:MAG: LON peptidase substrate-binding domain-containing protein, partial [Bartonella sp.]|nr:LON peptidase substrate-binding domain-containing protein [Bartonella sp.]
TARAKINQFIENDDYLQAYVTITEETKDDGVEIKALSRSVISYFENYVKLNKKISPEIVSAVSQISDPSKLADTIASHLVIKLAEKQEILALLPIRNRLERVLSFMEGEISVLQVEKRIRSHVKRQMEKNQREYYLNEQLKAIQKELGAGDEGQDELSELEERIRKTKLSKEAREKA